MESSIHINGYIKTVVMAISKKIATIFFTLKPPSKLLRDIIHSKREYVKRKRISL